MVSENNNLLVCIKCYCGIKTTVIKKVTLGQRRQIWILSNFYRHLMTQKEFNDTMTNSESKDIFTNSKKHIQQNDS